MPSETEESITALTETESADYEPFAIETAPATAAPSPEPAPEPVSSIDPNWWLPVLGVLGVILVIGALGFFAWRIIGERREAKARRLERERENTAIDAKWQEYVEQHKALDAEYLHSETDWQMIFHYPAMTDMSVPTTAAMVKAKQLADATHGARPTSVTSADKVALAEYPKAVMAYQLAWDAALRHAKRVRMSGVPLEERRTINKITQFLRLAESSNSPAERSVAYDRARKLAEQLHHVTLPPAALDAIEQAKALAIEGASV